jgi:hypothetical protein
MSQIPFFLTWNFGEMFLRRMLPHLCVLTNVLTLLDEHGAN